MVNSVSATAEDSPSSEHSMGAEGHIEGVPIATVGRQLLRDVRELFRLTSTQSRQIRELRERVDILANNMADPTDLRTIVARAIAHVDGFNLDDRRYPHQRNHWMDQADAAIAAATPLIRAALYDELIAAAESTGLEALNRDIMAWQRPTFPDEPTLGTARHLVEEAGELQHAIAVDGDNIAEEIADVYMLTVAVASKLGVDLEDAVRRKLKINQNRAWESAGGPKGYQRHVDVAGVPPKGD